MRNSWGQQPWEPPPHVCGLHLQNSTRCPQWRADKGHLLLWQWTRESNHHDIQSILHLKGLLSRKTLSEQQSTGEKGSSPKAPLAFLSQPKDYWCSVTKLCPVLCNPMNCSMPGFSVLLYHPTFAQTHVHELVIPSNHLILCCPFFSCFLSFPASGPFPVSWLFVSGGQRIGAWASASVLPMNIQGWSPLGLTGWISLQSKGLSRVLYRTTVRKHQLFTAQPSL